MARSLIERKPCETCGDLVDTWADGTIHEIERPFDLHSHDEAPPPPPDEPEP